MKFTLRGTVSVLQCDKIKQIALYFIKEFILLSQVAYNLSHSFKRNLFVLPGCWCLCLKFLVKLSDSQKQKCIHVCKRRQCYSCVFICLGDFRVWKFSVEISDIDYSSTAKYRRYCYSSMDMYRCLEHCAVVFFSDASPLYMTIPVLEIRHLQQHKKQPPPKAFIPSPLNMLIYTKHTEIISLSTLWHLDLKDCEGATAAQISFIPWSYNFWLIKYHVVVRMVEEKFCISVCISSFIAIASWVCLGLFYLLFFYLHLFLFLFQLICPQQVSL